MKNATCLALILFISFQTILAQKMDSIWSKSTFSFNYGFAKDFHACCVDTNENIPILNLDDRNENGEIFGFEYSYRTKGKNEFGLGFTKQVSYNDLTQVVQTSFALINFEEYRIRGTKNFHYLLYKQHFIEEKLICSAGIYYLRFRDPLVEVWGNSDQTKLVLIDGVITNEFGVFAGLEYYYSLRKNFQIGLRTRLFYTQGYDESFESFELTPVLRFRLN